MDFFTHDELLALNEAMTAAVEGFLNRPSNQFRRPGEAQKLSTAWAAQIKVATLMHPGESPKWLIDRNRVVRFKMGQILAMQSPASKNSLFPGFDAPQTDPVASPNNESVDRDVPSASVDGLISVEGSHELPLTLLGFPTFPGVRDNIESNGS